jgi:hypothetical protein
MRVTWGLHSMKPVRILGDNRFMLELDSYGARIKGEWSMVVHGGTRVMPC